MELYEDEEQFLPALGTFIIPIEFNPNDKSFKLDAGDKNTVVSFVKQKNKCPEQDNYFIATRNVTVKYNEVSKKKLKELLELNNKKIINKITCNDNYIPISSDKQAECGYFIKLNDFLIEFSS